MRVLYFFVLIILNNEKFTNGMRISSNNYFKGLAYMSSPLTTKVSTINKKSQNLQNLNNFGYISTNNHELNYPFDLEAKQISKDKYILTEYASKEYRSTKLQKSLINITAIISEKRLKMSDLSSRSLDENMNLHESFNDSGNKIWKNYNGSRKCDYNCVKMRKKSKLFGPDSKRGNLNLIKTYKLSEIVKSATDRGYIPSDYGVICCKRNCLIQQGEAHCVNGGCTCVPQDLPNDIVILALDRNIITNLTDFVFKRYSSLKVLLISRNRIRTISAKAFMGLKQMKVLMLDRNPIEELVDFLFSPMTSLKKLDLSVLHLKEFNANAFANLTNLVTFFMQYNRLTEIPNFRTNASTALPSLSISSLHLSGNDIMSLRPQDLTAYPKLRSLFLRGNPLSTIYPFSLSNLTDLKYIDLSYTAFLKIKENSFDSPSLENIYLLKSYDFQFKKGYDYFGRLPKLQNLTLDETKVKSNALRDIIPNPLASLPSLRQLNMRNLQLKDKWVEIFLQNLTKLNELDMNKNEVSQFSKSMFQSLPQNMSKIFFIDNSITKVLRYHLPDWMWKSKINNTLQFNFYHNPFNCDCDILWLKRWLNQKNGGLKLTASTEYKCFSPPNLNGTLIRNLQSISVASCFSASYSSSVRMYVVIFAVIACYVISTFAALINRYIWHARYFYFVYKNKLGYQKNNTDGSFEYDAFVSYCSDDRKWVLENLARFETEAKFKFCFHDRDWIIGKLIEDNMIETMRASRKQIFVVSNSFCQSPWCQEELQIANSYLIEARIDNVILILLEELDQRLIPDILEVYLNRTFIEWPGEEDHGRELGLEVFWNRLGRAIGDRVLGRDQLPTDRVYSNLIQRP